jgi:TolB-like protein
LWKQHLHKRSETATAAPQEHGATVIVLPFETLSADADDRFLAAGLSQQLITDLMRFAGLKLYSVPASFRQSPTADPVNLGRRLSAVYVVKGSLRTVARAVRLSVSLVDSRSGQVLWSETYDRPLTPESVLEVQADLAERITTRLGQPYDIIREMTTDRIASDIPRTMTAYGFVLQVYVYRRRFARELYAPVRGCLENTVRLDPSYADAWALLGWVHLDGARFGYVPETEVVSEMEQAFAAASHAVDLAPQNLVSLQALSAITYYRGAYDEAEEIRRHARARDRGSRRA